MLQFAIVVFDATTMWALLCALGEAHAPLGVYAGFMIATLFRSLGILPGGLGSFEAASVITLRLIGVPVAAALAATLLFRGLSFWLPMLPGLAIFVTTLSINFVGDGLRDLMDPRERASL